MDTAQFLADLRAQRDRINQAIAALELLNGSATTPQTAKTAPKAAKPAVAKNAKTATVVPSSTKKRVISPEARQRMAEAQQKRWAKKKRAVKAAAKKAAVAPVTKTTATKATAAPAATKPAANAATA